MQLSMNAPRLRVLKIYERRDQKNAIRFVDYGPQKLLFPVLQIQTNNISESASRSCRRHKARVRHCSDPRALPLRITPASRVSSAD